MKTLKKVIKGAIKSKNPLKYLIGIFLIGTHLSSLVTINREGYFINLDKSNIALNMWVDKNERIDDEKLISNNLKKDDVFFDIGANIGTLTLKASRIVGDLGRVYCFEPNPSTYRVLIRNIKLNSFKNIKPFNLCLGEKKDTVYFSNLLQDDVNKVDKNGKIKVYQDKLDNLTLGIPRIDLMKIDVEGYEIFVLRGANKTLKKTKKIIFEANEENYSGFDYTTEEVIKFLKDKNFEIYKVKENGEKNKIKTPYKINKTENLIAINKG